MYCSYISGCTEVMFMMTLRHGFVILRVRVAAIQTSWHGVSRVRTLLIVRSMFKSYV